jgi:hypothetical protein
VVWGTVLDANFLRVLTGQTMIHPCTGEEHPGHLGMMKGIIAHEMGHTFYLNHPCNGGPTCPERALMWNSSTHPDLRLLQEDRRLLAWGPSFAPRE